MECGSMVAVGRRMGGEEAAWGSDMDRKGMLEVRVWAVEAKLGSVSGQRKASAAVGERLGAQGNTGCNGSDLAWSPE